jgi:hypothetical protein
MCTRGFSRVHSQKRHFHPPDDAGQRCLTLRPPSNPASVQKTTLPKVALEAIPASTDLRAIRKILTAIDWKGVCFLMFVPLQNNGETKDHGGSTLN